MIKNTLVSIEFEIKEDYNKNYGQWDSFIESLTDILDYYKSSIYKAGKIVLNKRIGIAISKDVEFTDMDNQFISEYKVEEFTNKLKQAIENCQDDLSKDQLYDQLIAIIIGECIVLFKHAQINECKNQGIDKVRLISDDIYSCDDCKINSKFVYTISNFDKKLLHPYCKLSILPISTNSTNLKTSVAEFVEVPQIFTSAIKNITTKITIQLKKFVTPKKFIFSDISAIKTNEDTVEISKNLIDRINIEELIVRELLKDKLLLEVVTDMSWWEDSYKNRKNSRIMGDGCVIYSTPFINNTAQFSCKEYFIQSYIAYILRPQELQQFDSEAYNKLKEVFNKEFIKG